jgi:hypothetical protein
MGSELTIPKERGEREREEKGGGEIDDGMENLLKRFIKEIIMPLSIYPFYNQISKSKPGKDGRFPGIHHL